MRLRKDRGPDPIAEAAATPDEPFDPYGEGPPGADLGWAARKAAEDEDEADA